jgi:hypothetical protein
MSACVDLEIGLHRREIDSYAVELRGIPPESDAEVRLVRSGQAVARFDLSACGDWVQIQPRTVRP